MPEQLNLFEQSDEPTPIGVLAEFDLQREVTNRSTRRKKFLTRNQRWNVESRKTIALLHGNDRLSTAQTT
jgi:hypothetical protein